MDRTTETAGPAEGGRLPRRSPLSRLSFGHLVMISAGLLAFLLNVLIIRDRGETVEVPVAAQAIRSGARLETGDIAYESVDAEGPWADRALSRRELSPMIGRVAVRDIAPGAPLLADDLRPAAAPGAARAMSIPAADQAAGAGLYTGDLIDVITVNEGRSRFIASGVEVLAVSGGGGRTAGGGSGVTVAVSRAQALAIAEALDRGSIHLLRSTGARIPAAEAGRPAP